MKSLIINGGKKLKGVIDVSGAKNAALPIMAGALLVDNLSLFNVPNLTDIDTMTMLLESLGCKITNSDIIVNSLIINSSNINNFKASYDIVSKMRASIWVLAPLLARFGKAEVSLPGGCAIGTRQVDMHLSVLESMGAKILIEDGYIKASASKLHSTKFIFENISVGATITGILASVLASGETNLHNCAIEPEIIDLCKCLNKMGAKIQNIGTSDLLITGRESLDSNISYNVMPDRIEAGTYMIAAAITKGELLIRGISYDLVENLSLKLLKAGVIVENQSDGIFVKYNGDLISVDIDTHPYPGFPTDLQAQFMGLMTLANGRSVITENIFENRFMHAPELCRMGADIKIHGSQAVVTGVSTLKSAEVTASDLRASVTLVLAALATEGASKINKIYHLDRGYDSLEVKLQACGADIERVNC
jgi:UDP-N-acetylglucosamine 1-carboxyvinyltransferase